MDDSEKKSIGAREILDTLSRAKPTLIQLKNKGKAYDALINEILLFTEDYYPSSKELCEKLTVNYAKLKRGIDALYKDYLNLIRSDPDALTFQTLRVLFSIEGLANYAGCYCRLPALPRVGEQVNLLFINATSDYSLLYVNRIQHDFENGEQLVVIYVSQMTPYAYALKQRAEFENRFSHWDLDYMSRYELEDYLRTLYKESNLNEYKANEKLDATRNRYQRKR